METPQTLAKSQLDPTLLSNTTIYDNPSRQCWAHPKHAAFAFVPIALPSISLHQHPPSMNSPSTVSFAFALRDSRSLTPNFAVFIATNMTFTL